jgi:single-stranded DNA-binding protein
MIKTTQRYKQSSGEIVERAQQIRATVWGKPAELNQGVEFGDLVSLEGRLSNRKTQAADGSELWKLQVTGNTFEVLSAQEREKETESMEPPSRKADEFDDSDIPF